MSWILLSAPVYQRAWILSHWFEAIEKQTWPLEDIGFIFRAAPEDKETHECLFDFHSTHPQVRCFDVEIDTQEIHESHPPRSRRWSPEKYRKMARMRNHLLNKARALNPDRFFSLDTDILLENPKTIERLFQLTETLDAVSPLIYMTPPHDPDSGQPDVSLAFPGVMTWIPGTQRAYRADYPIGSLFQADIIMGAVMMNQEVYKKTDYSLHRQGEDLGFAFNAVQNGFRLFCASDIYAAHVMHSELLEDYLKFGDPRSGKSSLLKQD